MFEKILDEVLLLDCKSAVLEEKRSTARVLCYLSEIDKRRLWLKEGYSSLFDFCMRFLHYSEGETRRRIHACRLLGRVDEVKPLLEEGKVSLTTLCLLSPYVFPTNAKEILPLVTLKSSREVEKVIETHFPESKKKEELLSIKMDEELKLLLEEAKLIASEKEVATLLKVVFKNYLREKKPRLRAVKRHTRYVPQCIARDVEKRDNYTCTFVSRKGVKCNQKAHLQKDHRRPWTVGGSSHDKSNLRLLCRAHNLYLGKLNFPDR